MSFTRVWPGAGLAFNAPPGSANLTQLDLNVSRAIDGFAGGTYAPTNPLVLGGSGVDIAAPFAAANCASLVIANPGTLTVNGSVAAAGTSTWTFAGGASAQWNASSFLTMANGSVFTTGATSTVTVGGTFIYSGSTGIVMSGAQPAANADPGANAIHSTNQAKAWGNIEITLGVPAVVGGYNISGVIINGLGNVQVNFVRPMVDSNYAIAVNALDGTPRFFPTESGGLGPNNATIRLCNSAGAHEPVVLQTLKFSIVVFARQ